MAGKSKPNKIVSFFKTPVFMAKEYLHRRPNPGYRTNFVQGHAKSEATAHARTLEEEGIIILPRYFQDDKLQRLQSAFAQAVRNHEDVHNPDSLYNEDIMHSDPMFLDAALDDFLLEIVGNYYRKSFAVGRASAMRLLPSPPLRDGSFQWHHDTRGRQVHVMVLLSDVTSKGQRMTYLRRSHHRYYSHARGQGTGSRFEIDVNSDAGLRERVVELTGPAGSVGIFDSNGLHSGNRSENEHRDAVTFCYVSHRHFKKIRARRSDIAALPPLKQRVMTFNPYLEQLD